MTASQFMKTSDSRFSYQAAGDLVSPPLVFLHGIGGAARAWGGQLGYFKERYRAIAWDMPGYGRSTPLSTVSIATLADAFHDFLQQIGASKPILVGHSIGHDRSAIVDEEAHHRPSRRIDADQPGIR